jgi:hypothetical protein
VVGGLEKQLIPVGPPLPCARFRHLGTVYTKESSRCQLVLISTLLACRILFFLLISSECACNLFDLGPHVFLFTEHHVFSDSFPPAPY